MKRKQSTDWHRLFGLLLMDFFTGAPFEVILEKDLAHTKQLLDVVILRKGRGHLAGRLPDGLDELADHNLITFKSHQESLDDWALKELTGHYVNYRKQLSPGQQPLLPEGAFGLYAVCARYPHNLAGQVPFEEVREGVYACRRGTDVIRVVVTRELPEEEHNAPLHLFTAVPELVQFGQEHYRLRSEKASTLLQRLFERYQQEGLAMPYTMDDFLRDYVKENLEKLTPAERLAGLSEEEIVKALSPEERLKGLSDKEIEDYLNRRRKASAARPDKSKGGRRGRSGSMRQGIQTQTSRQ